MITSVVKDIKKDIVSKGKSAGKPFYKVFLENGDLLFAWEWSVIKDVKKGAECDFEVTKNGNFTYINNSRPHSMGSLDQEEMVSDEIESEDVAPLSDARKDAPQRLKLDYKDLSISRMSVLKSAIEYAAACQPSGVNLTEDEIVTIAERFLEFIANGK